MRRCVSLLLYVTTFVPAACQASHIALDVPRYYISFAADPIYRALSPCVNIKVGTPPQSLVMFLDIADGDIVVQNQTDASCLYGPSAASYCTWGSYSRADSTTFELQYGQNVTDGKYGGEQPVVVKDIVTVGDHSFPEMNMVATVNYYSMFGIGGYPGQEHTTTSPYSNVPISLKDEGVTSIVGYSLYLQRNNVTTPGRLIFGGVETAKFSGSLETLQIAPIANSYGNLTVALSNVSLSSQGIQTSIDGTDNLQLTLTPFNPGMALPASAQQQLLTLLNLTEARDLTRAEFSDTYYGGSIVFRPTKSQNETTINLRFGAISIEIPIWDMLVPFNATHSYILIADTADYEYHQSFIGAPFFSSAYSVFDFTHNELSIAPIREGALSTDNIISINGSGVSGLAGYIPQIQPHSGLSSSAKAGIGIGVVMGALLVIGAASIFLYKRRRSLITRDGDATYSETHNDKRSTAYSSQFGDKAELPAKQGGSDGSKHDHRAVKHQYKLLETEDSDSVIEPKYNSGMEGIRRKPVAPQELP